MAVAADAEEATADIPSRNNHGCTAGPIGNAITTARSAWQRQKANRIESQTPTTWEATHRASDC